MEEACVEGGDERGGEGVERFRSVERYCGRCQWGDVEGQGDGVNLEKRTESDARFGLGYKEVLECWYGRGDGGGRGWCGGWSSQARCAGGEESGGHRPETSCSYHCDGIDSLTRVERGDALAGFSRSAGL